MQGPVMHMMGYDPFRETPGRRGASAHARTGGRLAFPGRRAEDLPGCMSDA